MDGSHLCHHEHCIVHLTYESADTNLDRWNCCLEARFLRQEGRKVPEHCGKPLWRQYWDQYSNGGKYGNPRTQDSDATQDSANLPWYLNLCGSKVEYL